MARPVAKVLIASFVSLSVFSASPVRAEQPDGGSAKPAPLVVMGSLDKGIIRGVIHKNRAEITKCEEQALLTQPGLAGKVALKFVISATGAVSTAEVHPSSTIQHPGLGACMVDRVKAWKFPAPKGGGVVVVTYPFLFKRAGSTVPDAGPVL